jgi:O-antigen/teichoic acid export membrane protein
MARRASDPAAIGALYIAALRLLALIILPGMACLAAFAPQLIPILLTERWSDVSLVFALAAPAFALEAATSMAGLALYAAGRTGLRLRMATERAVLQISCVAVAVPFGLATVAVTLSLFAVAYTPRLWWYLHRGVPFRWQDAFAALAWPAVAGAVAWVCAAAIIAPAVTQSAGLLLAAAVGTVIITCAFAALPQLGDLRRDVELLWAD